MGRKPHTFMIVDTETATFPFLGEIARNEVERKNITIARPLVYDIGWTIINRRGDVLKQRQFLIAETFAVPSVFNTAYYREKRPIYCGMIERGEIEVKPWNDAMKKFEKDLSESTFCVAYNAMFDFKKAIPFTELYISKLYSANYQAWEDMQRKLCKSIAVKKSNREKNPDFDKDFFNFRGKKIPMLDIWGLACDHLINTQAYKKLCLKNGMVSNSGDFFKTSAESTFRYLSDKWQFEEAHTALEDTKLEAELLTRIFKRKSKAIEKGIIYFPFKKLGHVTDFLLCTPHLRKEHFLPALSAMEARLQYDYENDIHTSYTTNLQNRYDVLSVFYHLYINK